MKVAGTGSWTSPSLEAADDAVAAWAAETLAGLGAGADALFVATLDAGARESVHFWRQSRVSGLAFANPRPFPWTLANSPTGEIARRLGVRGPTFTLVGRVEALTGALEQALEELASDRAQRALVAALDGISDERTRLAAVLLSREADGQAVVSTARRPEGATAIARATASETLAEVLARLGRGEGVAVGSDGDTWITMTPVRPADS
jgi:3-oxoacyl-(acyl-carrier-protein) synthase